MAILFRMGSYKHIPVAVAEVLEFINPRPGGIVVDATIGVGGHASAILPRIMPGGTLIGLDIDPEMLKLARENLMAKGLWSESVKLFCESYTRLPDIIAGWCKEGADGILIDAGVCTDQLFTPGRGFSFLISDPLDARFNQTQNIPTARDIVNKKSLDELAEIFYRFGDEPRARQIARAIVAYREKKPIETTKELGDIVARAIGTTKRGKRRIHLETRVFQALRIAVNDELNTFNKGVQVALDSLAPRGRLVVISYHSGEDRIVKNLFRSAERGELKEVAEKGYRILTPKPVTPTAEEIARNPRARSAKLRAIERVK